MFNKLIHMAAALALIAVAPQGAVAQDFEMYESSTNILSPSSAFYAPKERSPIGYKWSTRSYARVIAPEGGVDVSRSMLPRDVVRIFPTYAESMSGASPQHAAMRNYLRVLQEM
jgi:hypothetical protein